MDRQTVGKYLHAGGFPAPSPRPKRPSLLDGFRDHLETRWQEGCRNGPRLLHELLDRDFKGKRAIVADALARLRRREQTLLAAASGLASATEVRTYRASPREVRWWFVRDRDALPTSQRQALDEFLDEFSDARLVYDLAQEFRTIVRHRQEPCLAAWLDRAALGPLEIKRFAWGIERDRAAVAAALSEPWSNGQTEGQIHRLKLIKRIMYGRANFDLLRRRVLESA